MAPRRIAIASDHAGFDLKEALKAALASGGYEVHDLGPESAVSVDYPDYAHLVGTAIEQGEADRGVLVCGSGIGMSIAANRHPGVRAALCHDVTTARLSRRHNDANVLALGARLIGPDLAKDCLEAFLETDYEGGRHDRRLAKLTPDPVRRTPS